MTLIIFLRFSKVLSHSFCFCRHSNNEPQIFFERQHLNVCHLDLLTTPGQLQNIHDYDHWHIVIILFIGTSFMNPRPAMLDCPIINTLFIQHLHKCRFVTHIISHFFYSCIYIFSLHFHSARFCHQHPVNLLLHGFFCVLIKVITDNIYRLSDFLCKSVSLCRCIHHFFHNHQIPFCYMPDRERFVLSLPEVYL